jgi:hypothetical protein
MFLIDFSLEYPEAKEGGKNYIIQFILYNQKQIGESFNRTGSRDYPGLSRFIDAPDELIITIKKNSQKINVNQYYPPFFLLVYIQY